MLPYKHVKVEKFLSRLTRDLNQHLGQFLPSQPGGQNSFFVAMDSVSGQVILTYLCEHVVAWSVKVSSVFDHLLIFVCRSLHSGGNVAGPRVTLLCQSHQILVPPYLYSAILLVFNNG